MRRPAMATAICAWVSPFLLATCIAFAAQHWSPKSAVGDGGVSTFYSWDKPIPNTPGKLLRQEPLPENQRLANASQSIRVLYTSTDGIDGKTPVSVSGAIFFPKGSAPAGGWPVVAWAHGTTGIADVCAPSWTPRSQRDMDYLNAWLAQGYAVVATDYQGLGTPGPHLRSATRPEGWAVLDAVRSALSAFPQLANSVVIVGQSQGAQAAISAALSAKDYAPELKVKGTVATGVSIYAPFDPPTKAPQVAVPQRTGGGLNAAVAVLVLYTYADLNPTFTPYDFLSDGAKPIFDLAKKACLTDLENAADQNHVTAENALKKRPENDIAAAAKYMRYPNPHFAEPIFIGSGLADKTALPEGQYNFVMAACYAGSTVEAHYYPGKDHSGTVNASLVDSVPFVKKILAGQSIASNCLSIKPPIPDK